MKAILEKIPHEEWDAAVQKISFRLWPMFGIAVAMAITAACILFFVAPAAIGTERLDQQGDKLVFRSYGTAKCSARIRRLGVFDAGSARPCQPC